MARLHAQPGWEGGVFVGGAAYQGDLLERVVPELGETGPALGAFARFYLNASFSLRTDLLYARYSGNDQNASDPDRRKRNFRFDSQLGEVALLLEWDPLGRRRFPGRYRMRNTFSPFFYAGAGLGYLFADPEFNINGSGDYPSDVRRDLEETYPKFRPAVPLGMGLRLDLSDKFSLSGMVGVHYLFSDHLDGIKYAANPNSNDWLWTGGLQLTMRFMQPDSDADGIVDADDRCPRLAGVPSAGGCPDMDGDGVEDAEDVCPDMVGLLENNGCPDSDGDGLMDRIDDCPTEFGFEETGGCPDRDNDCVADALDECPDDAGLARFGGCPDSDNDGFSDPMDPCPADAGLALNGGCPLPDSDCDGLLDRDDDCPRLDGGDHPLGCPDTDQDGLADNIDKCPELAGDISNGGCPDLEKEEKELITNATSSVSFQTGSAILLASSKQVLDEVVELMRKYPYYHLRIEGYTDDRGNDVTNLRLSRKRAESCYDYLLFKGIGPARMTHQGYGESDPIGDNRTEAGRRLNRRVEFEMYIPEGF